MSQPPTRSSYPAPPPGQFPPPGQPAFQPPYPQQYGPPPGFNGPPPQHYPLPPAAAQKSRTAVIVALLVGLIIGAGAITALALTGVIGAASSAGATTTVNTAAITLPDTLNGLRAANAVVADLGGDSSAKVQQHNDTVEAETLTQVTAAYGGAAADVKLYSDDQYEFGVIVHAVRAPTPGLTLGAYVDAEYLGVAAPLDAITGFGDVTCQIHSTTTQPAGEQIDPADQYAVMCQRSNTALTVKVYSQIGFGGNVDQMVATTNAAWDTLTS